MRLIILVIGGFVLSILAQMLAISLSKLFVGYDQELYELTIHAFRLFSFAFIFSGVGIYSSVFFTTLNNGFILAILSFMRSFVFLLPFLFDIDGIWWAMFTIEVCATIIAVIFFIIERGKYNYA